MINGLWVYDIGLERFVCYKRFEKEVNSYAIHRKAFLYNKEAWFVPQNGRYIAVVNLDNYDINYIDLPFMSINQEGIDCANSMIYDGGIFDEHYLYLIPSGIDAVNIFDLRDKSVVTFYNINTDEQVMAYGFYHDNKLYMYSWERLKLKILDIKTGIVEDKYYYEEQENGLVYGEAVVDYEKNIAYIAPGKDSDVILYLNMDDLSVHKIHLNDQVITEHALDYGNEIVFWGLQSEKIVILDKESRNVRVQKVLADHKPEDIIYASIDSDQDKIALSRELQCWCKYVPEAGTVEVGEIRIDYRIINDLLYKELKKSLLQVQNIAINDIIPEICIPLDCFLACLDVRCTDLISKDQEDIGRMIWNKLKV